MNRREFLLTTAATALTACGCNSASTDNAPPGITAAQIDAGPAARYGRDGVYDQFKNQGFFIIRQGPQLTVLSSYCTHRHCKLEAENDHTFYCPCHGSCFDELGKVTEGPATRNLPQLPSQIDAEGHLIVKGVI